MTSAAPARKPYRKAPPQHRETRHALPTAAPQHDLSQVNQHSLNTPPTTLPCRSVSAKHPRSYGLQRGGATSTLPHSDSELEVSSLSSLEVCVPPSGRFASQSQRMHRSRTTSSQSPAAGKKPSPSHRVREDRHRSTRWSHTIAAPAAAPRSILKHPGSLELKHTYDIIRKSQSVELLADGRGKESNALQPPTRSLRRSERCGVSRRSSDPSSPSGTKCNQRMHVLKEKVRFSNFLDEITCRVMSPAHLSQLGKTPSVRGQGNAAVHHRRTHSREWPSEESPAERSHRWDHWVSSVQRPDALHPQERAGHRRSNSTERTPRKREKGVKKDVQKRHKHSFPLSNQSVLSDVKVGVLLPWGFLEERLSVWVPGEPPRLLTEQLFTGAVRLCDAQHFYIPILMYPPPIFRLFRPFSCRSLIWRLGGHLMRPVGNPVARFCVRAGDADVQAALDS